MEPSHFSPRTPESLGLPELPAPWEWRIATNAIHIACAGTDIFVENVDLTPDVEMNTHEGRRRDEANYDLRWIEAANAALRFATGGREGVL